MSSGLIKLAVPAEPAQRFEKGLFVEDPLYSVVSELQSDQIVQALKDTGYPSTIVPFDKYDASSDCLVTYVLGGIAAANREYEVSGSMEMAAAALLNADDRGWCEQLFDFCGRHIGLDNLGIEVACSVIFEGPAWPIAAPACGAVESAVVTIPGTPAGPGGTPAATPASTKTCFSQTCMTQATRTTIYTNRCNGTTTSWVDNCTIVSMYECCVSGTAAFGPGNTPPCTLALKSKTVYAN